MSNKIITLNNLGHFYDKINDKFITYYKELVNDAEEGSLAIITKSEEPKSINDYLEFNPDSIALTGFNLPMEVDDSKLSPLLDKTLYFLPTGYTSLDQIPFGGRAVVLSIFNDDGNIGVIALAPELSEDPIYLYVNADQDTLNSSNITANGVQPQALNKLNQYISSIDDLKFYGLIYGDVGGDFWFTDIEITQEEIDSMNYLLLNNSMPTDLYIRRNNTWQNITKDIDWLKNLNNIANNIDSNQIKFEMNPGVKDFVESQGIEYDLEDINPNAVEGAINYNAYVSAAAYAIGNAAIQYLNDYKNDSIIKTTYSNLVSIMNRDSLSPGTKYRIVDYSTIVRDVDLNDDISSANKCFDIIVTALTNNTLSEDAKAIKCFNTERYESKIADVYNFNDKNTWYEYGHTYGGPTLPDNVLALKNEAGIDTIATDYGEIDITDDNINLYKSGVFKVTLQGHTENDMYVVGFGATLIKDKVLQDVDFSTDRRNSYYLRLPADATTGKYVLRFYAVGSASSMNNGGVGAKAELFEDALHYFDNSDLNAWEIKYCLNNDTNLYQWANPETGKGVIYYMKDEHGNECPYDFKNILFNGYYTFTTEIDNIKYDSTVRNSWCYSNIILPAYNAYGVRILNKNIFINNQESNVLCVFNKFGFNCTDNKFGNNCSSNTFGNYCVNNEFGTNCLYNTFADYCQNNRFYNYCQSNTIGAVSTNNSFGSYIIRTTLGKQCTNCKISNSAAGNDMLLSYCRAIKFGDQCSNINLYSTKTTSLSEYLQNIEINTGVSGSVDVSDHPLMSTSKKIIARKSDGNITQYIDGELQTTPATSLAEVRDGILIL